MMPIMGRLVLFFNQIVKDFTYETCFTHTPIFRDKIGSGIVAFCIAQPVAELSGYLFPSDKIRVYIVDFRGAVEIAKSGKRNIDPSYF